MAGPKVFDRDSRSTVTQPSINFSNSSCGGNPFTGSITRIADSAGIAYHLLSVDLFLRVTS